MKTVLIAMAVAPAHGLGIGQESIVRRSYLERMASIGLAPLLASPLSSKEHINSLYRRAGGVLLMGGYDINPKRYGAERHPETETAPEESDEIELWLAKKAIGDRKPILGICRGIQVINVACGGTLHQYLPELELSVPHGFEGEGLHYESLFESGPRHPVRVVESTKLSRILPQQEGECNTAHRQGINELGEGLVVSAATACGTVEAVEHSDPNYFCVGVQSHMEAENGGFFEPLFGAFSEAIKPAEF